MNFSNTSNTRSVETPAMLVAAAQKTNETCPRRIDNETRLDTMVAGPGNRLTYIYTMLKRSVDDLDRDALLAEVRPQIINRYKTDPKMAYGRDNNVEMHHVYRDKDAKHIGEVVVSPKDF